MKTLKDFVNEEMGQWSYISVQVVLFVFLLVSSKFSVSTFILLLILLLVVNFIVSLKRVNDTKLHDISSIFKYLLAVFSVVPVLSLSSILMLLPSQSKIVHENIIFMNYKNKKIVEFNIAIGKASLFLWVIFFPFALAEGDRTVALLKELSNLFSALYPLTPIIVALTIFTTREFVSRSKFSVAVFVSFTCYFFLLVIATMFLINVYYKGVDSFFR